MTNWIPKCGCFSWLPVSDLRRLLRERRPTGSLWSQALDGAFRYEEQMHPGHLELG